MNRKLGATRAEDQENPPDFIWYWEVGTIFVKCHGSCMVFNGRRKVPAILTLSWSKQNCTAGRYLRFILFRNKNFVSVFLC